MKKLEKVVTNPNYKYDEACLDIYNLFTDSVDIYGQYSECDQCDYQLIGPITGSNATSLLVNTKYSLGMYYKYKESVLCPWNEHLLEHYRYGWNLSDSCNPLYIKEEADNVYIPIFTACILFTLLGTMWYVVKCIYKCTRNYALCQRHMWRSSETENNIGSTLESPLETEPPPIKNHLIRLKSIDVFRGFCIMLMIFVNNGGGRYWFFQHAPWNGLTFADLVFPWFTWIMGVSMTLSFTIKLHRATPRKKLIVQVLKRSVILILLGVAVYYRKQANQEIRVLGVLQRLGLCYLIVGLLEAIFAKPSLLQCHNIWLPNEIISSWPQWLIMTSMVIIYTCVIFLIDVPGCGRGYFGPGGLHGHGKFENCTGGITGYIDRSLLGNHLPSFGSYMRMYKTSASIDGDGSILGTFPGAFLAFLGVHAGRIMVTYKTTKDKISRLLITGFVLCLCGASLCNFSKNEGVIPINRNLWSLSLITVLGGLASFIFAFLHVVIDVVGKWGGWPFFYPGMNPLVLYVCHKIFNHTFPFSWTSSDTHAAHLGMNLWTTILWLCISVWMYKNNIFISV